ncbi:MAG TPA: hypothetical protein VHR41_16960 [Gemmatimonadales bacterium]|nr:hypothetical protein [Gemmatimonadales bacterium]
MSLAPHLLLVGGLLTQLALPAAAGAQGQGNGGRALNALNRQMLDFGTLFAGTPTRVSRLDALRAGQFELRGAKGSEVRVDLGLPSALTGPRGAKVPLGFGPGDAGYTRDGTIATAAPFDPRSALITTLSGNGRLYLFLGGTASPAARQTAGTYAGTITLTIAYTGT